MEDTYTKILDKFAKLQYNPNTNRKDFKDYAEMKKVYTDHDVTIPKDTADVVKIKKGSKVRITIERVRA